MEGIEVIETEWGSPLHRELIAHKATLRAEWMKSDEAAEEGRRMLDAPKLEWERVIQPRPRRKKIPIYTWQRLSR